MFRESWLLESHLEIKDSWELTTFFITAILLWAKNKLESSANKWKSNKLVLFLKSFIYKKKSKGPNTLSVERQNGFVAH